MRSGLLKDKIEIYRSKTTTNDFGEKVQNYVYISSTRARVINNSGSRENSNGEIFFADNKIFEIYKYVDIIETDYILLKNKKYRILSIEEVDDQNKKVINTELINE